MKTEAIVASAGIGRRLKSKVRKPYLEIAGKSILAHTLQALGRSEEIDSIIVVVNGRDVKQCLGLVKRYRIKKIKAVVPGGRERSDSVRKGLYMIDEDTDIVLIHDGVRPFIEKDIIKKSIKCAAKFGGCVVGVPVKATVKKVHSPRSTVHGNIVEKTIDRKKLWEAQTPQVFKRSVIVKAYEKFGDTSATDDSMLVEKSGLKVRVVMGSYKNIKITTPEDLVIAEGIAKCG